MVPESGNKYDLTREDQIYEKVVFFQRNCVSEMTNKLSETVKKHYNNIANTKEGTYGQNAKKIKTDCDMLFKKTKNKTGTLNSFEVNLVCL